MKRILILVAVIALFCLAWVRIAPSPEGKWHVDPQVSANQDLVGGVRRNLDMALVDPLKLHSIILDTPRTQILAGSPSEDRITYITRTRWLGLPDYTTVQMDDDHIEIYARQRFGTSDNRSNMIRVDAWLNAVKAP